MNEQSEPLIPSPPPEPDYVGDDYHGADGAWSDPTAGEPVRFAGCGYKVEHEIKLLGEQTNV